MWLGFQLILTLESRIRNQQLDLLLVVSMRTAENLVKSLFAKSDVANASCEKDTKGYNLLLCCYADLRKRERQVHFL